MTKARNLANIIDSSGNLVVPNAAADATNIGIIDGSGKPLSFKQKKVIQQAITVINCGGVVPSGNCDGALAQGYKDANYNKSSTYINADGVTVNQPIDVPAPPNGNWWTWSGLGFTGVPTGNCGNPSGFDFAGGSSNTLQAVSPYNSNIFGSYQTTEELLGSYQLRTINNCNCGTTGNCYTNCNCNCNCNCDCGGG